MKLNFEGIKMQKWNIPTDRALRGDEENGFICLVIIFTSGVTVIKVKIYHILYSMLMTAKHQSHFEQYI